MTTTAPRDPLDQLQQKLVALWDLIGQANPTEGFQEDNSVVVVPSLSVDVDLHPAAQQAYEERMLFMLFLLRQPRIRLIYVTSQPIEPAIIDYYLNLIPGIVPSHARKRLHLVSPGDGSPQPLTAKLLDRPPVLRQIRSLIPDVERTHLAPFNTTEREGELALELGIPMYAPDPRCFGFGTKSGSRRVFAEEGVRHPLGVEGVSSVDALVDAIARLRAAKPSIGRVVVKLDEGVSGEGNALIDLTGLPRPGHDREHEEIARSVRVMTFAASSLQFAAYVDRLGQRGGVVEELIAGEEMTSPSVQLRVTPHGQVQLLSTHDQMLGGTGGQSYLGASFPANPAYGHLIAREAMKVGRRLAREGVIGRFAIDFVTVRSGSEPWQPYAIEINLRKGGTTHPFLTLQYLTGGAFDAETGAYHTARHEPKCYLATDHLESPHYRGLTPDRLFDLVSQHRLQFHHATQVGVVLHMISSIRELGRIGLTAIADTPSDAQGLYGQMVAALDQEAE